MGSKLEIHHSYSIKQTSSYNSSTLYRKDDILIQDSKLSLTEMQKQQQVDKQQSDIDQAAKKLHHHTRA